MIKGLQMQKEGVLRLSLNLLAQKMQDKIDQLQDQINKEEHFLLAKPLGETERKGILKQTKKHCDKGRSSETEKQSVTCVDIDVNKYDTSSKAQISISPVELPEPTLTKDVRKSPCKSCFR